MHIFTSSKERKSVQWATIFKYARMKDKCVGNRFCRKWWKRQTHKEMDVTNVHSIKLWHLVNWMLTESFEKATPSSPLFVDRIVDWMAYLHTVVTERIRRPPDFVLMYWYLFFLSNRWCATAQLSRSPIML